MYRDEVTQQRVQEVIERGKANARNPNYRPSKPAWEKTPLQRFFAFMDAKAREAREARR